MFPHRKDVHVSAARSIGVAVVGVLALAACSSSPATSRSGSAGAISGMSGRAILDRAYADARQASSVHISGSGNCPQGPFIADLRLASSGSAVGTVSFPPDKLNVLVSGDALYVRGPKSFWAANVPAAGAAAIGTRWVRSSNPDDNRCVRALTSYSALLANFLDLPGPVTKGARGTVLGKQVVELRTQTATVFVTTTDSPLPVRVDALQGADDGGAQHGISFGEWNVGVDVTVPATDQTVDAATLFAH